MVTLGYGLPLPALIPTIQTTIVAINIPKFYTCVQEPDLVALNDTDDEGLHVHFLLDLTLCTYLFVLAMTNRDQRVIMLKTTQSRLWELLLEDELDIVKLAQLTEKVEAILKLANKDELSMEFGCTIVGLDSNYDIDVHTLLAKLKIYATDMCALEDFSEGI